MSQIFNLPPLPKGSEKQQLEALRGYLIQMSDELNRIGSDVEALTQSSAAQTSAPIGVKVNGGSVAKGTAVNAEALAANVKNLKSLIGTTADTVRSYVDSVTESLRYEYVAQSDFGSFQENITTIIEQTARNTVETYDFIAQIESLNRQADSASRSVQSINGEIRRGILTDPQTGEELLGIAVAEQLSFTGEVYTREGAEYYELSPGQTLGFYTSSGWQFWVNGSRRGWFSSADGMLHITNLVVESGMQLGDKWLVSSEGGFGIRWVGG